MNVCRECLVCRSDLNNQDRASEIPSPWKSADADTDACKRWCRGTPVAKAKKLLLPVLDTLNECWDLVRVPNALQHAQHCLVGTPMQRPVQSPDGTCTPWSLQETLSACTQKANKCKEKLTKDCKLLYSTVPIFSYLHRSSSPSPAL